MTIRRDTAVPDRSLRVWAVVGAAALALGGLAGCGDDDSGGGSAGSGADEVTIRAIGVFESPVYSSPDGEAAMQAAVDAINADGGVNGHTFKISFCNDKFDPNVATDCARKAVEDKVDIVTSHYTSFGPQMLPILEQAKIADFFAPMATEVDGTSPVSFPRDGGVPGGYGSLGIALAGEGCTKVGVITEGFPATELGTKTLTQKLEDRGVDVENVNIPTTAPDMAAPVSSLLSQGIDCLVPSVSEEKASKIATALAQADSDGVLLGAVTGCFSSQGLAALGPAVEGTVIVGQEYRPSDTDVPAVSQAIAEMAKYTPDVELSTSYAVAAWGAIQAIAQLVDGVDGDITSEKLLDAAETAKIDSGMDAPVDFSADGPDSDYPRAKNWGYLVWDVKDGKSVLRDTGFTQPSD